MSAISEARQRAKRNSRLVRFGIYFAKFQDDLVISIKLMTSLLLVQVDKSLPCYPVGFFDTGCRKVGVLRVCILVPFILGKGKEDIPVPKPKD